MSLYGAHVVMACRDIAKGNVAAEKIRDIRKVINVVHHNYLFTQLHVDPSKLYSFTNLILNFLFVSLCIF